MSVPVAPAAGAMDGTLSIKDAQQHFDQYLSKRIQMAEGSRHYRLAFPGETQNADGTIKAIPYSFFGSVSQLDEFGIGISLYFKTVKALFIVLLCCSLICLVAMYENFKFNNRIDGNTPSYTGNRTVDPWLGGSAFGATRDDLKFDKQGASDIAVVTILTLFMFFAVWAEKYEVIRIDEAKLTTQDYSVEVTNPQPDVYDVQAYYEHFKRFGEVVYVTIAVSNGELLASLADELVLEERLEGAPFRRPWKQNFEFLFPPKPKLETMKMELTAKVERLCDPSLPRRPVYRVFVIFNTEKSKRDCLEGCATSYADLLHNESNNPLANFKGRLLNVIEPFEPTDFIYDTTHINMFRRWGSWVLSFGICFAALVVSYFIVNAIQGGIFVALFLTVSNSVLPTFILLCTQYLEIHVFETRRQTSSLLKLFIMRCVNSGVLIYLAYSFEETFSEESLKAIQGILFADAWLTPLLRGLDVSGRLFRYVVSPIVSNSQAEMEDYWRGTDWTLAERYTDVLKSIFVALFFLVPLPSGLFISCFNMVATYVVDKYCLFNIWRRPPALDAGMSLVARYGLGLTIFAHIVTARVYFVNWPFITVAEQETCSFLECPQSSFLTRDQNRLNNLYSNVSITFFAVVMMWIFFYSPIQSLFEAFSDKVKHKGEVDDHSFRNVPGLNPYIPLVNRAELEDSVLAVDVSCLPFGAVPVNVWDDVGEVPQDFSVADVRKLPFLLKDPDYKQRVTALFGEVAYFDPEGNRVTTPFTARGAKPGSSSASSEALGVPRKVSAFHLKKHGHSFHRSISADLAVSRDGDSPALDTFQRVV